MKLVSVSSTQGVCQIIGNVARCDLGNLGAKAGAVVNIVAQPTAAGIFNNPFVLTANEPDPNWDNNLASVSITAALGGCVQPVTTPIEIMREQWRSDERNRQDELILTIKNKANHSLDPRLIFVFYDLPRSVTIDRSGLSGYTQCVQPLGSPYIVSQAPNGKEWKPNQLVSVRVLFNNPSRRGIPYHWKFLNGAGIP